MSGIEDLYLQVSELRSGLDEALAELRESAARKSRRRLSKDEILGAFLTSINRTGGEHSAVTLKTNAKGETQIEVTVRSGESDRVQTAQDALAEASRLYLQARETFGLAGIPVAPSKAVESDGAA